MPKTNDDLFIAMQGLLDETSRNRTESVALRMEVADMRKQLDLLDSHVRGNGSHGLLTRMVLLEQRSDDREMHLGELKTKVTAVEAKSDGVATADAKGKWLVASALASAVVAVVSAVLSTVAAK